MQYGPVMIDVEGKTLLANEKALLAHPRVGGVILFTRNFENIDQLKALVSDIRAVSAAARKSLLISVDHEGGRVWRFKEGFTRLPAARKYAEIYATDPQKGLQLAKDAATIMASELLDCGLDFSLAPVLDLDKGVSEVIGDRSFGTDPKIVSELAKAFVVGMNAAGMQATGKHFPGHGGCALDSHIAQPVDTRTLEALLQEDIVPFANLSTLLGAVMPAHITYKNVDTVPAGFSRRWLQTILREQLGFKGAVISDCLSMQGAAIGGDFVVRAQMALDAGCDMVILCQQSRDLVAWFLDNLARDTNALSHPRLAAMAGHKKSVNIANSEALTALTR